MRTRIRYVLAYAVLDYIQQPMLMFYSGSKHYQGDPIFMHHMPLRGPGVYITREVADEICAIMQGKYAHSAIAPLVFVMPIEIPVSDSNQLTLPIEKEMTRG